MDPVTALIGIAGLGMSIFGAEQATQNAKQVANVSTDILGLQVQENQQRQLAAQVAHRRTTLQIARNTQRLRALSLSTATNQGAGSPGSSGVVGAMSGIQSEGTSAQTTENQQFDIGNALFGLQNQISGKQALMAQLQGQQATNQGIMGIGGALMGNAGTLGNIFGNLGGMFGGQPQQMPWQGSQTSTSMGLSYGATGGYY